MNRATLFGRVRTGSAIAGLTVGAVVVATLPSIALTSAAWSESEWTSARQGGNPGIGTLECDDNELFSTRGAGNWLSGDLFAIDLAAIAELEGEEVTMTTGVQGFTPGSDDLTGNAYANPLNVNALDSALSAQLGNLLTFPALGVDVGAVNQYGMAKEDGTSAGAAGAVNDSGAIDTGPLPGNGLPTVATLQLGTLLNNVLGTGLGGGITNLTDVRVNLGAVASNATLDACAALWDHDLYANLDRTYLIAGANAQLVSPLVGNLVTTVQNTTSALQTAINGVGNGIEASVQTSVLGGLTGILTALGGQTGVTTAVDLTVNFAGVNALLDDVISDPDGIVAIDLASGLITVDLAALFDDVNGLNNQKANTQLLIDDDMINDLTDAIEIALADWVASVGAALTNAVTNAVTVAIDVDITVAAGNLELTFDGPLGGALVADFELQNCALGVVLCTAAELTVDGIGALLGGLLGGVTAIVATVPALITAVTGPIITTLLTVTLPAITGPIVTLLGAALDGLFGEDRLVSILINAQNSPDPLDTGAPIAEFPEPYWAATLSAPITSPYESGQFDVSALRVTVLGALGGPPLVGLDFARSSVGNNVLN